MHYHIAVCDDEKSQIDSLTRLLQEWAASRLLSVRVTGFESAESFLFHYEDDKSFDFILLDIEMGEINGVTLAEKLRSVNREIQIIFVTGYTDYIASGYDMEALHYLLKPVTAQKLFAVLDRGRERLGQNEKALLLESTDGMVRIPLYEIRYLEVRQNYVTIHADEDYTVKKTLSQLEKELDESFFRTGRSWLVNLRYVKKITKTDVYLKDQTVIPLSRGLYNAANQALIRYF